jgi:hypothetical protein
MSATHLRSGGSHTEDSASRRLEPDDVARPTLALQVFEPDDVARPTLPSRETEPDRFARPTLDDLAAQPQLQLLQVGAASGPSDRAATAFTMPGWDFDRAPSSRGECARESERASFSLGTSKSATKILAALATTALISGCAAKSSDQNPCLQAAAGQSFQAPAPGDVSTEGGGLSDHQRGDGRARDVVPVPVVSRTVGAGGAASKLKSSGTDRAVRDRRGLVDAWPEAEPSKSRLTDRAGLFKG